MLLKPILLVTHYIIYLRSLLWSWLLAYSRQLTLPFHKNTLQKIASGAKTLDKLPIHLGIVIVEDDISYTDIANVILWCMAMGISYVSVYDRNGICKRQKHYIEEEVKQRQNSFSDPHFSLRSKTISLYSGFPSKEEHHQGAEGDTTVVLLERRDGLPSLVTTARRLATSVRHKHTTVQDITPANVDALLQEEQGRYVPDPDMILRFGVTQCMMGYLPWQIRLSEILSLPSHHKLEYETFYKAIVSYGNTEQRFGK